MKKDKDVIFNKIDTDIEMTEYDLYFVDEGEAIVPSDNFPVIYIGEENRLMLGSKKHDFDVKDEYTREDILKLEKDISNQDIITLTGEDIDSIDSAWHFDNATRVYSKQNFEWVFSKGLDDMDSVISLSDIDESLDDMDSAISLSDIDESLDDMDSVISLDDIDESLDDMDSIISLNDIDESLDEADNTISLSDIDDMDSIISLNDIDDIDSHILLDNANIDMNSAWHFDNATHIYSKQNFEWVFSKEYFTSNNIDDVTHLAEVEEDMNDVPSEVSGDSFEENLAENEDKEGILSEYLIDDSFSFDLDSPIEEESIEEMMALLDITGPNLNINKEWEFSVNGINNSKDIFDWTFSKKFKDHKIKVDEEIKKETFKYVLKEDEEIMCSSNESDNKLKDYSFSLEENDNDINDYTEDSFNGDFVQSDLDKATKEFEDTLDKTDIDKINNSSLLGDDAVRFNELMLFIGEVIEVMPDDVKENFAKSEHYDSYIHFLKFLKP